MVREKGTGRHDGQEYWTLPGGGIQPGETPRLRAAGRGSRDLEQSRGCPAVLLCLILHFVKFLSPGLNEESCRTSR